MPQICVEEVKAFASVGAIELTCPAERLSSLFQNLLPKVENVEPTRQWWKESCVKITPLVLWWI